MVEYVFCQILDPPNLYFDTGLMTAGLLISEIIWYNCVADMFFKMAAEYGRSNSLTYLKMFYVKSLTPKNLYFDTGIMTVCLLISEIYTFIYVCGGHVFQDGRRIW